MKDLKDTLDKTNEGLCEVQSCIEMAQTILEVNSSSMGVSKHGDYPHQMEILLALCLQKVKKIIEDNNNAYGEG